MAASPKKQSKNSASSFKQYEASTQDAWDDGDDDLLAKLKLDATIIQSAASQVLNSHHTSNSSAQSTNSTFPGYLFFLFTDNI